MMRLLSRTPVRTFIIYPIVTFLWELFIRGDHFTLNLWFLPLLIWGYLQYRLCGRYRKRLGGGGPGIEAPPEKLVATGPYAYTRNPMYLGHIIFLTGLTLTLQSWLAGAITIAVALWFHTRVLGDERKLVQILGVPYENYLAKVKRWVPGFF
ncbi:MAG TPA: isoprenylcysteine carboxylmethyltransferase family protein [Candidatus Binatia bacterium]